MDTSVMGLGEPLVKRSRAMVLGSGRNPVSFVAADDVAWAAARLAGQDGEGYIVDLGGPQALTITRFNELIATTFGATVQRRMRLSAGMLRFASRILRPFNEVTSRQLLFDAF
jgi:nucleoside-diphosphate-sugar epimerase